MTIQMANKLVELRKAQGLSQEEVADSIGVSRQAVSKWERAEAAPDTDNLIALANLYKVSVDELLCLNSKRTSAEREPFVEVELPFIKVKVRDDKSDRGKDKNTSEADGSEEWFSSEADSFYSDSASASSHKDEHRVSHDWEWTHKPKNHSLWNKFPYPILATVAFLVMGFVWNLWHPGWIVFLTIPVYYWLANAISTRRFPTLSVSGVIGAAYLVMGFGWGLWHPYWIMLLAIPIFDFFVKAIKRSNAK